MNSTPVKGGGGLRPRPADFPDAAASGKKKSLVMFQAMETQSEADLNSLKSKMSSSMSPVRSDLEEIVGKKAGGGGASPSPPSAAPRKASKSFVISSEERAGPAAQP